VFRALGEVLVHADAKDPRSLAPAGMKAFLGLMPTMKDPKSRVVLSEAMRTLVTAFAEEGARAVRRSEVVSRRPLLGRILDAAQEGCAVAAASEGLHGAALEALGSGLEGFHVTAVREGTRAAQLGLAAGDTIVEIQGGAATPVALRGARRTLRRGGELSLAVIRQGERMTLKSAAAPAGPR
jgi:S1-C subfamily serine protease